MQPHLSRAWPGSGARSTGRGKREHFDGISYKDVRDLEFHGRIRQGRRKWRQLGQ